MRKLSTETIRKITTLHRKGESERAIARQLGISRSAVWYRIQQAKK